MSEREAKVLRKGDDFDTDGHEANVRATTIAEHVAGGWTVEAVQWSDEPGEALCVVLWRAR